jgi:PAS domain S-box-containing protein
MIASSMEQLQRENEELRRRLEEAEEAIRALRAGEVDAVVVEAEREQVYTLEAADKPYRLLVEQMPYAAATLTSEGEIIHGNRYFADLLRRPLAALLRKPISSFIASESQSSLETLLREGQTAEVQSDINLQYSDGTQAPVRLGVRAVQEGALGSCLMVTDLTEKRHYEELQRTQEALHEADRKKDEFLATLAHELRNPLAPIRNAVQILKAKAMPPAELDWARGVLERQVQVMARLLEDLLDITRISRGKLELRKERVELATVVDAAVETSRPVIEASGHRLSVALPSESLVLDADPLRLAQVFANLLTNAAKYTEEGGRVELTAQRKDRHVVVAVRDSGIGIAPEMLPHIFDIFSQAKPALERSQGGLGIGLSLVKGLVELHGGSIAVHSDGLGQGSEFIVRLPIAAETPASRQTPSSEDDTQHPVTRRRILIVDDNCDGTDSLAMLLKLLGHEVETAYDGEQGIQTAQQSRPNVVLLDLGMPRLNGFEACRRIRQTPWGKDLFLIALTGWGQDEDRRRTEAAGFDHHMTKPVDPAALMELLASLPSESQDKPAGY